MLSVNTKDLSENFNVSHNDHNRDILSPRTVPKVLCRYRLLLFLAIGDVLSENFGLKIK